MRWNVTPWKPWRSNGSTPRRPSARRVRDPGPTNLGARHTAAHGRKRARHRLPVYHVLALELDTPSAFGERRQDNATPRRTSSLSTPGRRLHPRRNARKQQRQLANQNTPAWRHRFAVATVARAGGDRATGRFTRWRSGFDIRWNEPRCVFTACGRRARELGQITRLTHREFRRIQCRELLPYALAQFQRQLQPGREA